jgi:hypothetical protein
MTVGMMSRAMEKETGGCCEGEGKIHPCYSQGYSRTSIPQLDAPFDRDILPHTHTRRYAPFRESRLPMNATRCNRIVERVYAVEMTNRLFSSE